MDELPEIDEDWGKRDRLLKHLESMVVSGRVTEPEASRLRGARDQAAFGAVLRDIRVRHAEARFEDAVDDGRMSREEADAFLERMRRGEHTCSLRGHLPSRLFGGRGGNRGSGSPQAGDDLDGGNKPAEAR